LLPGGAGPLPVAGVAQTLAGGGRARAIVPTHPGFGGPPRPAWLDTVPGLALVYRTLLDHLHVEDVTVVGNSIGGWIAAELALLHSHRISGIILVDGVGIDVPDHPVADIFPLTMDQVAELSYHDPERFRIHPASLS